MLQPIQQAKGREGIVERLGKYLRTLPPGMSMITPFVDKVRFSVDMREQVIAFPPQDVVTQDDQVVEVDAILYLQVTDSVRATYEVANYVQAIEQLTQTTLRNVVEGMDRERALRSRGEIIKELQTVLEHATPKWGIKVNRVDVKRVAPRA